MMDDGRLSVLPSLAWPNFISVCHCLRGFGEMVVLDFGFMVQGMVVADCFYMFLQRTVCYGSITWLWYGFLLL